MTVTLRHPADLSMRSDRALLVQTSEQTFVRRSERLGRARKLGWLNRETLQA